MWYALAAGVTLVVLGAAATGGFLTPLFLVAIGSVAIFFITSLGGAFPLYAAEVYPIGISARRAGSGGSWARMSAGSD